MCKFSPLSEPRGIPKDNCSALYHNGCKMSNFDCAEMRLI